VSGTTAAFAVPSRAVPRASFGPLRLARAAGRAYWRFLLVAAPTLFVMGVALFVLQVLIDEQTQPKVGAVLYPEQSTRALGEWWAYVLTFAVVYLFMGFVSLVGAALVAAADRNRQLRVGQAVAAAVKGTSILVVVAATLGAAGFLLFKVFEAAAEALIKTSSIDDIGSGVLDVKGTALVVTFCVVLSLTSLFMWLCSLYATVASVRSAE
jgi:hypothetical protein